MATFKVSGGDWTTGGCVVAGLVIVGKIALRALELHTAVSLGLLA
jgi:hypothetical protein